MSNKPPRLILSKLDKGTEFIKNTFLFSWRCCWFFRECVL